MKKYNVSIVCDGEYGKDKETPQARANLLAKLLLLAKIGYVADPFEKVLESGTTGRTHYGIVLMSDENNPHHVSEITEVCPSTRCWN